MELVFPESTDERQASLIGGKALGMVRLSRMGVRVPAFFVVSSLEFLDHLSSGEVPARFGEAILALAARRQRLGTQSASGRLAPDDGLDRAEILKLAGSLRNAVEAEPLAPQLREKLTTAMARIGPGPYAVRSSMAGEDSARHSFAGQLDSFLHQASVDDVAESIVQCWGSAFGERAISYALRLGLDLAAVRMGVVVQQMLDAEVSGVLFTADPSSGRRDQCVLAAAWGLGEGVVSGLCETDEYRWQAETGETDAKLARKDVMLLRDPAGRGTRKAEVSHVDRDRRCLSAAQVEECCALGLRIARTNGMPQDIEWSVAGGQLWILQARPITSLPPFDESAGPRIVWDNSNIQESYSGVTTPLTFSFAARAYETVYEGGARLIGASETTLRELRPVFRSLLVLYQGRVYYNLGNWYRKLQLAPGFDRNRKDLDALLGVEEPVDLAAEPGLAKAPAWQRLLSAVRTAYRVLPLIVRLDHHVAQFRQHFDEVYRRVNRATLETASMSELMARLELLDRELLGKWHVEIVNIGWVQRRSGDLRRLLSKLDAELAGALYNDLLSGESELESVAPTQKLLHLAAEAMEQPVLRAAIGEGPPAAAFERLHVEHPAFASQLDETIERYGDRVIGELKLETVTLRQDPGFLIAVLRNYLGRATPMDAAPSSPPELRRGDTPRPLEPSRSRRHEAERIVESRLNAPRRWRFRRILESVRAGVRTREALRFNRTRMFGLVRDVYRAIGQRLWEAGRLEEPRDVFYLTIDEISAYHEGRSVTTDLGPLALTRKTEWAKYGRERPENRFETRGPVGHAGSIQRTLAHASSSPRGSSTAGSEPSGVGVLRGTGCYPGNVEAAVRLLLSPDEDLSVNGKILATVRTDPGWAPLFPTIRGLLVERGSTLSHSAIVARELGIPTIVGLKDLTKLITDGERVRMDGASGLVERLDAAEPTR